MRLASAAGEVLPGKATLAEAIALASLGLWFGVSGFQVSEMSRVLLDFLKTVTSVRALNNLQDS